MLGREAGARLWLALDTYGLSSGPPFPAQPLSPHPLAAGRLSLYTPAARLRRPGLHPGLRSLLEKLLGAGADPLLPHHSPFLATAGYELAGATMQFLLGAHAAGRRRLEPATALQLLLMVLRRGDKTACPQLLAIVRQEEGLDPDVAMQVLAAAACFGDDDLLRDAMALLPPGALAAPEAAPACLLGQAALHRGCLDSPLGEQRERRLRQLLDAKAVLRVEDLCLAVQEANAGALRCLLQAGQPQVRRGGRRAGVPARLCSGQTAVVLLDPGGPPG